MYFNIVFYSTCSILIACHAYALWQATKHNYTQFSRKMIKLYLLYNSFSMVEVLCFTFLTETNNVHTLLVKIVQSVIIVTESGSMMMINLAMWMLGFHYFNCSRKLPYYIRSQQPPDSLSKRLNIVHMVLTWCNVAAPVAFGVISFL